MNQNNNAKGKISVPTQEANIEKLVDTLSELTVLDLSKLKKALEDKWDVKAAAGGPVMMAAAPAAADAPTTPESVGGDWMLFEGTAAAKGRADEAQSAYDALVKDEKGNPTEAFTQYEAKKKPSMIHRNSWIFLKK